MTEQPPSFPHRLLHQSVQEKLAYFKAYTVAHPALKQVDQAVWNALREPAGASLIFVFGPTGAGKTTLLAQIEKRLKDLSVSQMGQGEILLLHSDLMRYHLRSTSSNGPITIKGL